MKIESICKQCGELIIASKPRIVCGIMCRGKYINMMRFGIKPQLHSQLCECGCGQLTKPGNRFIRGHYIYERTAEIREKCRKSVVGRKLSVECIAKIVATKKKNNYRHSEEWKNKQRKAKTGKKHTEESKNKMRMAKLGKKTGPMSDVARENMSLAKRGKPGHKFTDEQKNKISISKRQYYAKNPDARDRISRERKNYFAIHPEKRAYSIVKANGESYPEKWFREFIESCGLIKGEDFIQELQVGRFFIDFAFPFQMIAIEIDGSQHLQEQQIVHDKHRDNFLREMGWKIFRFPVNKIFYDLTSIKG